MRLISFISLLFGLSFSAITLANEDTKDDAPTPEESISCKEAQEESQICCTNPLACLEGKEATAAATQMAQYQAGQQALNATQALAGSASGMCKTLAGMSSAAQALTMTGTKACATKINSCKTSCDSEIEALESQLILSKDGVQRQLKLIDCSEVDDSETSGSETCEQKKEALKELKRARFGCNALVAKATKGLQQALSISTGVVQMQQCKKILSGGQGGGSGVSSNTNANKGLGRQSQELKGSSNNLSDKPNTTNNEQKNGDSTFKSFKSKDGKGLNPTSSKKPSTNASQGSGALQNSASYLRGSFSPGGNSKNKNDGSENLDSKFHSSFTGYKKVKRRGRSNYKKDSYKAKSFSKKRKALLNKKGKGRKIAGLKLGPARKSDFIFERISKRLKILCVKDKINCQN